MFKSFYFTCLFCSTILAEPAISQFEMPALPLPGYHSPTQRFVEHYHYENILYSLKSHGLSLEHRNFFEHIIPHEEIGFFGYHSSTQGFRIFQDVIRMVLEEVCGIEIKNDFHFLRVPGKSLLNRKNARQFLEDYPYVNNNAPDQQEQLLSMNYALFGNFNNFGSCSVYYFTENTSATTVIFQKKIQDLFEIVGLPIQDIPTLFLIGTPLMETENAVLFQFFDFSHHNAFSHPYELVDRMCYPAIPGGIPHPINQAPSSLYLGIEPHSFTPQFRLVINNADVLIYQDIIRAVVEEILDIPIRKDFHFLSTPLDRNKHSQTLEELSSLFVKNYRGQEVMQRTFPLNFTLYGNHNCFGLNSVVNFSKNISYSPTQNRKELIQFFDYLGIDTQLLEWLYILAYQHIDSKAGLLLQLFDTSPTPYAFADASSYASYPNGFISENRLIHEFFLDNAYGEFPHEMRIILNLQGILNPRSPFLIKRYTKVQPNKLKAWEQELRALIKNSSFDATKKEELKQELLRNWNN